MELKSLPQLLNHFKDEATCIKYLEKQRWDNKPACPHCGCIGAYTLNDGRYKCKQKECHKKFSITVKTVFENSKIKLNIWFAAIYLTTAHKKGISSLQLHRDLGITQKSAWFMLHRIREMLRKKQSPLLSGTVQADETFVGGKNKNRHADKKVKESQGRSVKDKQPIFGAFSDNEVNLKVIPDTKAKTLKPVIQKLVQKGAIIVTDEWGSYQGLSKEYQHKVIKHNEDNLYKMVFI